jgi:hypothetical protein
MKTKLFTSLRNLDITRLWYVMGIVTVVWLGLAAVIPPDIYKYISVVLSAFQAGITFAIRADKYVKNRDEVPPKDLTEV